MERPYSQAAAATMKSLAVVKKWHCQPFLRLVGAADLHCLESQVVELVNTVSMGQQQGLIMANVSTNLKALDAH